MRWVIDTSVLAAWLLPDEASIAVNAFFRSLEEQILLAPPLIFYEIQNSLLSAENRQRISADEANHMLEVFHSLPIQMMSTESTTLPLARKYKLSIYDATYLQLALEKRAALATLDTKLAAAATAQGVNVLT